MAVAGKYQNRCFIDGRLIFPCRRHLVIGFALGGPCGSPTALFGALTFRGAECSQTLEREKHRVQDQLRCPHARYAVVKDEGRRPRRSIERARLRAILNSLRVGCHHPRERSIALGS
jgi:hypothetical protein